MSRNLLSTAPGQSRFCFRLHFFGSNGFALVVELFALGYRNLNFDPSTLEVEFGGNDSQALLARLAAQLLNLRAVQQEFPLANRNMVHQIAMRILADMGV